MYAALRYTFGSSWIRTSEGINQRIYNPPPLTTRTPTPKEYTFNHSDTDPPKHTLLRYRSGRTRTCDPIFPKDVRYQTALHSVITLVSGTEGFEPSIHGTKNRRLATWLRPTWLRVLHKLYLNLTIGYARCTHCIYTHNTMLPFAPFA